MLRKALSPFRTVIAITVSLIATWMAASIVTYLAWRDPTSPRIDKTIRIWSKTILGSTGSTLTVNGLENVDVNRSYVVVSNHQGALDIPAHFLAFPMPIRFFAKKELYRIPIFRTALRAIGIVEIDRQAGAAVHGQINSHSAQVTERGHSVLVFAEGTRFVDGSVHRFKSGAFSIAIEAGLPILPAMVHGSHLAWPRRRPIYGAPMTVTISKPIETTDLQRKDVRMLRDRTKREIETMIEAVG